MAINKTIELIHALNKHEIKAFDTFLKSPYFNTDKHITTLFNRITRHKTGIVTFQNIAKARLLPVKITTAQLRYLMTDLNKLLENFLAIKKLISDKPLYNSVLLKSLIAKDCDKSFGFTYQLQDGYDGVLNSETLLRKFSAEESRHVYYAGRQKRKVSLDYGKMLLNLDSFYVAKKLQLQCEILSAQNIRVEDQVVLLEREILQLAKSSHLREVPSVKLYYLLLLMITEPGNENHFSIGLDFINKNEKYFTVEEVKDAYLYIKNYCIKKINAGNQLYTQKLFDLYKTILSNRRMMYHDYFSPWEFKNLVTISLRLQENEWCYHFIKRYINYLAPGERVNAFNYNMAYWYWSEKKYHLSLKLLQRVEFTDVVYQLDSRAVILKIYYETDDYESLFYHLSAFRAYLRRNTAVSETLRIQYSNLIRYTSRIARHGLNKQKISEIKNALRSETKVADKGWLEKQVELIN